MLGCVEAQYVVFLGVCWLLDLSCRCVVRWVVWEEESFYLFVAALFDMLCTALEICAT
jgi:hypothetical protein